MAGFDGEYDGKGTVWVHDSPVGAPERDETPPPPVVARPAPTPPPAVSQSPAGPPPMAPMAAAPKRSGMGSTGCLIAVFLLGGVGLGLAIVLAIGVVGAAFMLQGS